MDAEMKLAIHTACEETARARAALESARQRYQAARYLATSLDPQNANGHRELNSAAQEYSRSSDAFMTALQKWARLLLDRKSKI